MKGSVNKLIEKVIEEFDFLQVVKVMQFVGWEYATISGPGVPDVATLKKTARELLNRVISDKTNFSTTGGFVARIEHDGNGKYLILEFVLEDSFCLL